MGTWALNGRCGKGHDQVPILPGLSLDAADAGGYMISAQISLLNYLWHHVRALKRPPSYIPARWESEGFMACLSLLAQPEEGAKGRSLRNLKKEPRAEGWQVVDAVVPYCNLRTQQLKERLRTVFLLIVKVIVVFYPFLSQRGARGAPLPLCFKG